MWAVRCCGKHHGIRRCLLAAGVLAVVCVALLVGCGGVLPDFEPAGSGAAGETEALAAGIDTVGRGELPPEARETLELVEGGGPFPYAKDGTVFHNYEGLLPQKSDGYYREYTVVTPGSSDRGARRIVAGADGEYYYTDDHYASFRLVVE